MPTSAQESTLAQLRKGVIEYCVLASLREGPSYGLALAKRLTGHSTLLKNEGTLYPLLSRLKKQGWVDSYWEESTSGPPRKYYTLTSEGDDALDVFLQSWTPFVEQANELLLPE